MKNNLFSWNWNFPPIFELNFWKWILTIQRGVKMHPQDMRINCFHWLTLPWVPIRSFYAKYCRNFESKLWSFGVHDLNSNETLGENEHGKSLEVGFIFVWLTWQMIYWFFLLLVTIGVKVKFKMPTNVFLSFLVNPKWSELYGFF